MTELLREEPLEIRKQLLVDQNLVEFAVLPTNQVNSCVSIIAATLTRQMTHALFLFAFAEAKESLFLLLVLLLAHNIVIQHSQYCSFKCGAQFATTIAKTWAGLRCEKNNTHTQTNNARRLQR